MQGRRTLMFLSVRAITFLFALSAEAQPYVNRDSRASGRRGPSHWSLDRQGHDVATATSLVKAGAQSLRIRSTNATTNSLGVVLQQFPIELAHGNHIRVSGWMRTENVNGYAAIWWRVDGASGVLSLDNMSETGPRGTTDWAQYSFERDVSDAGKNIVFGVFLSGTGTAWFDGLQIEINSTLLKQGPAPNTGEPTAAQVAWVASATSPLDGVDPSLDSDDLASLPALIGDAH